MFYLVGLGLFDTEDISLKGINTLKNADKIYAEFFTSKLFGSTIEDIEKLIGKNIIVLNRQQVEEENPFLKEAKTSNIALITGGDPLIATTHSEFLVKAHKENIPYKVIHASSIISSAPAISGLQAYKFGKVTTIPFPSENYFPKSPYQAIETNMENEFHTLILLDIQADKSKFMTINEGLEYLLKIYDENKQGKITPDTLAIGIARVGSNDNIIKADYIKNLIEYDFGEPLHCIIIPSKLHIVEAEYLIEIAGAPKEILNDV